MGRCAAALLEPSMSVPLTAHRPQMQDESTGGEARCGGFGFSSGFGSSRSRVSGPRQQSWRRDNKHEYR